MIMQRRTMGLQGLLALLCGLLLAGPAWAETEAAAPAVADQEEERRPELAIEGELANIGAIGLVPWENRFGLTIGVERLGEIFYGVATPQINYTNPSWGGRPFTMSFGVPLRFQILDARAALVAMEAALPARLRTQDVAGLIGVVRSRADVKRLIIKARGHYRRARSVGLYLTRIELNVGLLSLLLGDLQDATRCLERAAALELDGGFRLYALEVLDAARQLLGH